MVCMVDVVRSSASNTTANGFPVNASVLNTSTSWNGLFISDSPTAAKWPDLNQFPGSMQRSLPSTFACRCSQQRVIDATHGIIDGVSPATRHQSRSLDLTQAERAVAARFQDCIADPSQYTSCSDGRGHMPALKLHHH